MHKTLYRTYRPKNFDEVIGQDIIKNSLIKAVEKNKIAHAYLFAGKSGTGKTTLAKILAKAVNCTNDQKPCNSCETCVSINENKTMDVIDMDAASNNGVDQIRNLIDSIQYPPIVCKYKVYIIDEVHMLTTSAFNALLKTLEEPPSNSIFILATTEEHKIPETILTRCQRHTFKKVTPNETTKLLAKIMEKEQKEYDEQALKIISDMSNGSVRKALSIAEQCIHLDSKLTINVINEVHNLIPTKDLAELITLAYNSNLEGVYSKLEIINENSTNYHIVLEDILLFLKDTLVKDYINNNQNKYSEVIANQKISYDNNFIFKSIKVIKNTLENIKFSANPKLQFEICIFEITTINKQTNTNTIPVVKEIKPQEPKPQEEPKFKPEPTPEISVKKTNIKKIDIEIKTYNDPEKDAQELLNPIKNIYPEQNNELLKELKEEQKSLSDLTFTNEQEETTYEPHSEVLNILLTAIKAQREFVDKKIETLSKLERNHDNSKWLSIFSNCKIAAASNEAIIVLYEHQASSDVLNSYSRDNEFLKFIKENLGREYLFVGSWKKEWDEVVEKYKILKVRNELPKPTKVDVPQHQPKTILDKTELQEAQNLFGESLELEEWK